VDRSQIIASQRDALWVISLRAKLLQIQCEKQLQAARVLAARTRAAVVRATLLEQVHLSGTSIRHRKVVPIVAARRLSARRASALRQVARSRGRTE
jgi:hypothetical protein